MLYLGRKKVLKHKLTAGSTNLNHYNLVTHRTDQHFSFNKINTFLQRPVKYRSGANIEIHSRQMLGEIIKRS